MLRAILVLCAMTVNSEFQVTLHVVNGRTGTPVADKHIVAISGQSVAELNEQRHILQVTTDAKGEAKLTLHQGDLLRIWVDWSVPCAKKLPAYEADAIAREGVVGVNTCGSVRALEKPGDLYLYVRPESFWERFRH
jgi:hypothetical protein